MKKLLSLCLAVVMMVCLLAGVTVNAAGAADGGGGGGATPGTTTYEYFTFRRENFGIEYGSNPVSNADWGVDNVSGTYMGNGAYQMQPNNVSDAANGKLANAKKANVTITAKVYIDTPGSYTAFMHVMQRGYGFKIAIDGVEASTQFDAVANADAFATEKANTTWNLGIGWHTITVTSVRAYGKFQMILLTNNTDLTSAGITYNRANPDAVIDGKVNMFAYEDVAGPVTSLTVTPDANTEDNHRTSATLTWSVEDASDIIKYEIYNGTEWVDVTNETSYTVDNLWSATEYTFKLRVTDAFGWTTETTGSATTNGPVDEEGPEWTGTEVSVANASFSSTVTFPAATDSRGVSGYDIYENSVDDANLITTVEHDNPTATTYSVLVSLEPGETKNLVIVARDLSGYLSTQLTATVASQGGTENYTIRRENFGIIRNDRTTAWTTENVDSIRLAARSFQMNKSSDADYPNGCVVRTLAAGTISTDIYVEEAGTYTAFMMVKKSGTGFGFAINGQEVSTKFGATPEPRPTDSEGYSSTKHFFGWDKADRTWELEAGWNTITVTSTVAEEMFQVILLTKNTEMRTDEITYIAGSDKPLVSDGKLNIAHYEDFTGPVFGTADIEVEYNAEDNKVNVEWQAATGALAYKVFVNDKEIGRPETVNFEINETNLGEELVKGKLLNIKVVAVDGYSNASEKTLSYKVAKYVVADDMITVNVGTDVVASADITNVSVDVANIRLSIAIYDENGKMVAGEVTYDTIASGDGDTYTATITGAPDTSTYTVKAHLWDADDLTAIVATKTIAPVPAVAE